jgi:anti-anti-sigma factor
MSVDLHGDPVTREEIILRYLRRDLPEPIASELEAHYMACDECFEEFSTTRLLMDGLKQPPMVFKRVGGISILRFPEHTELLGASRELNALRDAVRTQNESRVLLDLSTVSRIDSAGLGVLMNCYCHVRNQSGAVKLLNPTAPVKEVLKTTRIDSVLETFEEESAAIQSFN